MTEEQTEKLKNAIADCGAIERKSNATGDRMNGAYQRGKIAGILLAKRIVEGVGGI